ncbi:hypothetical protein GOV03_02385 [Candidatus Woesearchaeota archaeon]|nr:hypothetical protein [Candidatus Woesearchaeota archaeon]
MAEKKPEEKENKEKKAEKKAESKTYVISAIQSPQSPDNGDRFGFDSSKGAPHTQLIEGLRHYCDINNAELMLLTMNGMDCTEREVHSFFRAEGLEDKILYPSRRNIRLNKNCIVSDDIVPPQNIDPATSRDRIVQADQTRIYAHSKQRFKSIASGNASFPKLLVTTGACTLPNYNETNHRGDLATKEHCFGAVIVEVIDAVHFNVRHIPALKNGKFIDMAHVYNGKKRENKKVDVEALVLGDIHLGDHDPQTMAANYQMIDFFKPKRLFLHDLVNGHSVNPHERDDFLKRAIAYNEGRLSIESELREAHKELVKLSKRMKKGEVHVVYSNHPFFIDRYLENGRFLQEPWNTKIALKLAGAMLNGENPVEYGIKMMGNLPSNVNFLKLRDDYKVWGWQLGSHGHKGISGARGSIRSRELGFGKSITGHTHAPEILRNTYIVGTSTRLDLPYTDGSMSRWLAANAVLYEGGQVQLLPIIDGKWRSKKTR